MRYFKEKMHTIYIHIIFRPIHLVFNIYISTLKYILLNSFNGRYHKMLETKCIMKTN